MAMAIVLGSAAASLAGTAFQATVSSAPAGAAFGQGYAMVGADGSINAFGNAPFYGSVYSFGCGASWQCGYGVVEDMVYVPYNSEYYAVTSNGYVCAFGANGTVQAYAEVYGAWITGVNNGCFLQLPSVYNPTVANPNDNFIGITLSGLGNGYEIVDQEGNVFAFGSSSFYGSFYNFNCGNAHYNEQQCGWGNGVGISFAYDGGAWGVWQVSSSGVLAGYSVNGYNSGYAYGTGWLTGQASPDGWWQVAPNTISNIVGMAPTPSYQGYWLVGSDGGIYSYGDANFYGSMGGTALASPIKNMAVTVSGHGYVLLGADGGVYTFGDAQWQGSEAGNPSPPTYGYTSITLTPGTPP